MNDHLCQRCGKWGSFGYGYPHDTIWRCGDHLYDDPPPAPKPEGMREYKAEAAQDRRRAESIDKALSQLSLF